MNTGWIKWRELSVVMCDERMPDHIRGSLQGAKLCPDLKYGDKFRPLKKHQVTFSPTTRILRWAGSVTTFDHIANNYTRGSFRVTHIPEKLVESRIQWYVVGMRRLPDHMTRREFGDEFLMNFLRRGLTWMFVANIDLKDTQIPPQPTQDGRSWRS